METAKKFLSLGQPGVYKYQIVGGGRVTTSAKKRAKIIAQSNAPALIEGETGTGKELFARYIHNNSKRRSGPFVVVDCSNQVGQLMSSALYGHEKGAFSGAIKKTKGKFEKANGGTIFLDEIGELAIELQSKLLRVVQEGVITRVGGEKSIDINVRVISATNRDLAKNSENGLFRDDLYYRINTLPLFLEPLRNKLSDIPALVEHSVKKHIKGDGIEIGNSIFDLLFLHSWPGNVRELDNLIDLALTMMDSGKNVLEASDIELLVNKMSEDHLSWKEHKEITDDYYLLKVFIFTGFKMTETAKILQLQRTYVSRLYSEVLRKNKIKFKRNGNVVSPEEKAAIYEVFEDLKKKNQNKTP